MTGSTREQPDAARGWVAPAEREEPGAMTEFGAELRRRREAAGLTLEVVGLRASISIGYLSRIERGMVAVKPEIGAACDRAVDAGGDLLALLDGRPGLLRGLPPVTRHFLGRDDALDRLSSVLLGDEVRIGVVHGLPGVGKTTVAVTAARRAEKRFPDGTLYLDLRGHTPGTDPMTPRAALHSLLGMLADPAERVPWDVDGCANLLQDLVRGKAILFVFDNVASAAQIRSLLPAEPRCRVLVTSRGRLPALDEAWHQPLGMLDLADAVALFRSVAGDRGPTGSEVEDIVELCGRLPLAVRIAAARFVVGGAPRLRERLIDERTRLTTLDDGERGVAAAFALSYAALTDPERSVFGLLAVHPGPVVEFDAVEAMAALPVGEAEVLLERLHDAGLIDIGVDGTVAVHDLVRAFAVRHAMPTGDERDAAVARLVDYALARVFAADELMEPARYRPEVDCVAKVSFDDDVAALTWLRAHWPTLARVVDLAARHGLYRHCWQSAYIMRAFFFRDKLYEPWRRTHLRALEAAQTLDDLSATAMILHNLGMACIDAGEIAEAIDYHCRALHAFTTAGDERGRVDAMSSLAWARLYKQSQHEMSAAVLDLNSALAAYRAAGRTRNVAITLRGIALALTGLGKHAEALVAAEEARAQPDQQPVDQLMALNMIAWVRFNSGELDLAAHHYTQAAALAELAASRYELARACTGLGNIAASRSDHAAARAHWERADRQDDRLVPAVLNEARVRRELSGV